ncbi:MAG: diguanylate cyclase [Desulfovibrio sp.]|nr:diguanylate cyclase [Desulfovibrio sp.]|tara:strand:- start:954 stop:3470 length:2517 start_codon:yes stop_codon:yes gene_type:complete
MNKQILLKILFIIISFTLLDSVIQYQLVQNHKKTQIVDVTQELSTLRAKIEKEVTSNLLIIEGTANFVSMVPDMGQELFSRYSKEALSESSILRNMTAAPDFVMKFVYPLEGNRQILGLNYRKLKGQWEQALAAKESGEMVVAGPVNLVQGGLGLIGRAPVFVDRNGEKDFWGIVSSVIDMDKLLQAVGLDSTDLNIGIRGKDGKGWEGDIFYGDPVLFDGDTSVRMIVNIPAGSWIIVATPKGGWSSSSEYSLYVHAAIVILALGMSLGAYRNSRHNAIIRQTQDSLNQAQAIAHLGSWRFDHTTGAVWWSEETYRIFGVSKETFTPSFEGFLSMVLPEDRAKFLEAFQPSVEGCYGYSMDHRIMRPDGEIRHIQDRGETTCKPGGSLPHISMGTVQDITERKRAEEALQASEERMRAMAEASYDALIVVDSSDVISFWSPAAEQMFGWSRDEAIGQKMHKLISPKRYQKQAFEGLERFGGDGTGPIIGTVQEMTAVRRNGEEFPVERSVSAFKLGNSYMAVGSLRDISDRKKIESELKKYADRLTLASKAGGIGVWELNVQTNALHWDSQMFRLYGVQPGEFSGLYEAWRSRVHSEDLEQAEGSLQHAILTQALWDWEFRVVWPNKEVRHIKAAALVQADSNNRPEYLIGVNWDVTMARKQEEQLRLLATTDDMTKLLNRRRFMEMVEREFQRSSRYGNPFSFIMFDVDKFKNINDTYGHDVGDMVLKSIASTARTMVRDVDILGRIGGEEFAVGLPETDMSGAELLAEKLRVAMENKEVVLGDGTVISFTISLGVATLDASCSEVNMLMKHADIALYQAKENGRNRVEMYEPDKS